MSQLTASRPPRAVLPQSPRGGTLVLQPTFASVNLEPVVLRLGRLTVGSDPECEVCVPAPGVAPRHCLIVVGPRKTVVKPLSPLTWINDGSVRESSLRAGDRLAVGPIEFTVRAAAPAELENDPDFDPNHPEHALPDVSGLVDEASARHELAASARSAHRDWTDHQAEPVSRAAPTRREVVRHFASPAAIPAESPAPDPSNETRTALEQQRSYLVQLAETLTGRERELTAREADVRCKWDQLQADWRLSRDLVRATHAQQSALAQERSACDAAKSLLAADREQLDLARARLDAAQAEAAQQADLLRRSRDELAQVRSELDLRSRGLDQQHHGLASERTRLEHERHALDERARELKTRSDELSELRNDVEARERLLAEAEAALDFRHAAADEREAALPQLADLECEAERLQLERESLAASRAELDAERARLDKALHEAELSRGELDRGRAEIAEARQVIDDERAQWEADTAQAAAEREELSRRYAEMEAHAAALRDDAGSRESAASEHESPTGVVAEHPATGDAQDCALAAERHSLQTEIETLRLQEESLRQSVAELTSERERCEAERAAAQQEVAASTSVESRTALDEEIAAERARLFSEWTELETARQTLESDRDDLCRQLQEFAVASHVLHAEPQSADEVPPHAATCEHHAPQPAEACCHDERTSSADADWHVADQDVPPEGPRSSSFGLVLDSLDSGSFPADETSLAIDEPSLPEEHEAPSECLEPQALPEMDAAGEVAETAPPADKDAVLALRTRLAELFGLSPSPTPHTQAPSEIPETEPLELPPSCEFEEGRLRDALRAESPAAVGRHADQARPASHGEEVAVDDTGVDPTGERTVASPDEAVSHEASIADYMQRLLARSRTGAAPAAPQAAAPDSAQPAAGPNAGHAQESRSARVAAVNEEPAFVAPPGSPAKTVDPEERVALRANLDSFRELANISARSAVAKHESKKLQTVVRVKLIVLVIATALTMTLGLASTFVSGTYRIYAWAAGATTLVMGFELVRTMLAFYRWKSVESAGAWDDDESGEFPEGVVPEGELPVAATQADILPAEAVEEVEPPLPAVAELDLARTIEASIAEVE